MDLYSKIAPILMYFGFVLLAGGVLMSLSYNLRAAYALVVVGFVFYVVGRIGVHFAPKKITKEEEDIEA